MAYIEPNSDVYLIKDIRITPNYSDTIYFANRSAQETYFFNVNKRVATLSKQSYARHTRGSIKVKLPMSTCMQANYVIFKNTSFENKYFYAFITDIEYINNNTTLIMFSIDVIQTWFLDCQLGSCFVDREHSLTDVIGANRLPEPIGSNRVMYNQRWVCPEMTEYSVILTASYNGNPYDGDTNFFSQGMFCGLEEHDYSITSEDDAQIIMAKLDEMIGDGTYDEATLESSQHRVVSLIMFPSAFCASGGADYSVPRSVNEGFQANRTNVNGYVPRNKKLLTAPFKQLLLTNGVGQVAHLDYDDFKNSQGQTISPAFKVWGVKHGAGQMVCVPQWYKGVENNYDFKITIDNFPQCGFTIDSYRAWLASGGDIKQQVGVVRGIGSAVFGALGATNTGMQNYESSYNSDYDKYYNHATAGKKLNQGALNAVDVGATNFANGNNSLGGSILGSIASAGANLGNGLLNTYIDYKSEGEFSKIQPDIPVGVTAGNALVAMKELNFRCYDVDINATDAQIIDEYFDRFGYATKRVKVPNISSRPHWNYTKTQSCELVGNIPANIKSQIIAIFDNGITFWKNGDEIGNYSLNNSPT